MEVRAIHSRISEVSFKDIRSQQGKTISQRSENAPEGINSRKNSIELVRSLDELENFFSEILQKKEEEKGSLLDLERLNRILLSINKNLKIELDDKLNIPIYKIIDVTTNEVLKQIPLEEILQFKRAFFEFLTNYLKKQSGIKGVLLNREV